MTGGARWRGRFVLALMLALPGCVTTHVASLSTICWQWLGDAQLSVLIAHAHATAQSPPSAQDRLATAIARRYIALRAQQSVLVLLAERENLDSRLVVIARQRFAAGAALRRTVAAAETGLSDTRADQARTRADIASLRVRLAVLTGSTLDAVAALPGGPIPLPPAPPLAGGDVALAEYRAAVAVAAKAQSNAMAARAAGTLALTLAPSAAVAADRRALAALQAEERARAAMALAYVALTGSPGTAAAAP